MSQPRFRFWFWLIRLVGLIVPTRLRADWRQEWEAELRNRELLLAEWDRLDRRNKLDLLQRSLGAFRDALLLQPRRWEDEMIQDIRFGVRMLLKHRAFTIVAVLTLALGIGATTAIFSVVNGVLLRALPFADPDHLVMLNGARMTYVDLEEAMEESAWKYRFDWHSRVPSLQAVSAYTKGDGGVNLAGVGEPERIEAVEVSANFFQTLGVQPLLGRAFSADEEQPGKQMVAVVSFELWQQRLNGATDVLGHTLTLNGKSFTIVGIAPPALRYPREVAVWIPLSPSLGDRVFTNPSIQYGIIGRLRDNATPGQTSAEINTVVKSYERPVPAGMRLANSTNVRVTPLLEAMVGDAWFGRLRQILTLLFGAVGFVLLIACANVANLLLALATTRKRELAVRAALGAGRGRLLRQSLTESCVLALSGGLLGLWLAHWLTRLLVWLSPPQLPRLAEITLDYRVLGFALGISLLTGILVGWLPAWRASRMDVNEALKSGSGRAFGGASRAGNVLVVAQVALSVVLLVGAGLLMRSFVKVLNLNAGFSAENVLTVSLSLPPTRYQTAEAARDFMRQLLERVQAQPQFQSVGVTNKVPLNKAEVIGLLFKVEGVTPPSNFDDRFAFFISASADYFRTMSIPLLQGRSFTERDTVNSAPVIIINEQIARQFFPDGNALGQRILVTGEKQPREIVGVVSNVRSLSLEREHSREMFLPYLQGGPIPRTIVLKTNAAPGLAFSAVQQAVHTLDKDLPLFDGKTMRQHVYDSVAQRSYVLWLMGALAVLGLLLTTAGIYGVISYTVTQRTHEIGIRMALGAQTRTVAGLILRETLALMVTGLVVGLLAAWWAARWLASLLYDLREHDPLTLAGSAGLLLVVALLASWLPARRATQVDPLVALRYE